MMRVLVALDESPRSLHAARTAAALFAELDTEFLVINVAREPVAWTGDGMYGEVYVAPLDDWRSDVAAATTTELRADAAEAGLGAPKILVEFGDVAERIAVAAEEHDVDVVVVGSHDKGFLRRLLEPSVTDQVVRTVQRPVLVVGGSG